VLHHFSSTVSPNLPGSGKTEDALARGSDPAAIGKARISPGRVSALSRGMRSLADPKDVCAGVTEP
jgi:hypothetical protein